MKKSAEKFFFFVSLFTLFGSICLIPSFASSETRGIQVIIEDEKTNEWKEIPLYDKTYAVIIGIDNYPNLPQEFQLSYAVSDAQAVERMLRSKFLFSKIYTLYNEQATKSNIMDLLLNKLAKVSKNDAVFVFFAGHGGQEKTDFGDIGYIVPQNGDFDDMRKVISMSTIRDDISKRIRAKHVFYVMDSCYSGILVTKRKGAATKSRRNLDYLLQIAKEPVRQVLTAGSASQAVLDGGPKGHSVFAGRFLEILNEADDFITANEISTLVKERVYSDARARGHLQTPKSGELFGLGDFVFMPSLTKKLGSIEQQITVIETELQELNEIERIAGQQKDRVAIRDAERKRKIAEAKLAAKKLEETRFKQEKLDREKKDKERRDRLASQKRQEEEEQIRLAALQQEIDQKRKKYKSSLVLSFDDAVKEMKKIEQEIEDIRAKYRDDLKKRILSIARSYSDDFSTLNLVKDEFETEAEYQTRVAASSKGGSHSNKSKFMEAMNLIQETYDKQVEPLLRQMSEIANSEYTFYGHDALQIKLGGYNADKQIFTITIASKNIKRSIYVQDRFNFITEVNWQFQKAGIKKGDMLLTYNGITVKPGVNWKTLQQTVITDTFTVEVERNGQVKQFTLKKGKIGIATTVDDYLKTLQSNQFVATGELFVPRSEARKFKQNYLNNFITAEVKVSLMAPEISLVTTAIVIDESNDKAYNLFQGRFVSLGHRLIFDNKNNAVWLTRKLKNYISWDGANKFSGKFVYKGIKGWQLPSLSELKSLRDSDASSIYWAFNFKSAYHTQTRHPKKPDTPKNHYFYKPANSRQGYADNAAVICLIPLKHNTQKYNIYTDPYLVLDGNFIFDTKNQIIWFSKEASEKSFTWMEADKFSKSLSYQGIKGWRLPTLKELSSLHDNSIPGLVKLFPLDKVYQTKTAHKKKPKYHYQMSPKRNRTTYGESGRIICVM